MNWLPAQGLRVTFLVNNAGLGDHGLFEEAEWSRIRPMLDVNIAALTHLTNLLVPGMIEAGRGAVLNVSSVAGFFPLPNLAVYAATKAYVTSFSEALAMELRPRGITVTALCPGPVPTEFSKTATRPGSEQMFAHSETMPAFVVTPYEAVRDGLDAVARSRARVIPGPILWFAVSLSLLLPFFITREVLRASAKKI